MYRGRVRGPPASASIHVADLPPDCTEARLFELFNAAGPVASIRVCRDPATSRRLGTAYVNFHASTDAARAIDRLNYSVINGHVISIRRAHFDPDMRPGSETCGVIVKNLDPRIDCKTLRDTFEQFGAVHAAQISGDTTTGRSKGFGYIHYATPGAAEAAIAEVDGKMLADKIVFVGPFNSHTRENNHDASIKPECTHLCVKMVDQNAAGLPPGLREVLSQFGTIVSYDAFQGKSFARVQVKTTVELECTHLPIARTRHICIVVVQYGTNEEATAARAAAGVNGLACGGERVLLVRAQSRHERMAELKRKMDSALKKKYVASRTDIVVKGLNRRVSETELNNQFSEFGEIQSCKVMRTEDGWSRGFAFVRFVNGESAAAATSAMDRKLLKGDSIRVAVAQQRVQQPTNKGMKGGGKGGAHKGKGKSAKRREDDPGVIRQKLGMQLYPMVVSLAGEALAGKVTGMLLEMNQQALTMLMKDSVVLRDKVNHALEVLQQAPGSDRRSTI